MRTRVLLAILFAVSLPLAADENPRNAGGRVSAVQERHYIVVTEHVLRPSEQAELAAEGVDVQKPLSGNRYIVRMRPNAVAVDGLSIHAISEIAPEAKIAIAARRATGLSRTARLRVVFHDDVPFQDAMAALAAAGATSADPLLVDYPMPQRIIALVPSANLTALAADDRVLAVAGPPLRMKADNDTSASQSKVTPLYSAPYNLSGNGVVVSSFELGEAQVSHKEFTGRATSHFGTDKGSSDDQAHATHTGGTMIAAGLDPRAKGMAPAATLHLFDANDQRNFFTNKQTLHSSYGIISDNNSWGFELGWQFDQSTSRWVWFDNLNYFGGYDDTFDPGLDKAARTNGTLMVHSAGNDASSGNPLSPSFFEHEHVDDKTGAPLTAEIFCYSPSGNGNDCPAPCSSGISSRATDDNGQPLPHCEPKAQQHPVYGPFGTMGVTASAKNVIAVGAVTAANDIAAFSSRGPTHDSRVKPDVVALGIAVYSSVPIDTYVNKSGTSMSAPVVTGIAAMLTEQWRKTVGGDPSPQQLKTLIIAGADDIGNPGPDYTFGFGLADAKASADLIIADKGTGQRIRTDRVSQGQRASIPLNVRTSGFVRVVLAWADPETFVLPNDLADKTLVNDLDLSVVDPSGNTVLPYVLDGANPNNNATRGVNTVDNVEEVEIPNAAPGIYHVFVTGSSIASGNTQDFVVVANQTIGPNAAFCGDSFEPNDTADTAYGNLASNQTILATSCAATDLDFYKFVVSYSGPVTVSVTASDTPLRLTLSGFGNPQTVDIPAGQTRSVSVTVGSGVKLPISPVTFLVEVQPTATPGANASYLLTPSYSTVVPKRVRTLRH